MSRKAVPFENKFMEWLVTSPLTEIKTLLKVGMAAVQVREQLEEPQEPRKPRERQHGPVSSTLAERKAARRQKEAEFPVAMVE